MLKGDGDEKVAAAARASSRGRSIGEGAGVAKPARGPREEVIA